MGRCRSTDSADQNNCDIGRRAGGGWLVTHRNRHTHRGVPQLRNGRFWRAGTLVRDQVHPRQVADWGPSSRIWQAATRWVGGGFTSTVFSCLRYLGIWGCGRRRSVNRAGTPGTGDYLCYLACDQFSRCVASRPAAPDGWLGATPHAACLIGGGTRRAGSLRPPNSCGLPTRSAVSPGGRWIDLPRVSQPPPAAAGPSGDHEDGLLLGPAAARSAGAICLTSSAAYAGILQRLARSPVW